MSYKGTGPPSPRKITCVFSLIRANYATCMIAVNNFNKADMDACKTTFEQQAGSLNPPIRGATALRVTPLPPLYTVWCPS